MSVDYFEIVGKVIDRGIDEIAKSRNTSRDVIYSELIRYLAENQDEWYKPTQPNIKYDDPVCRLAYLYGQVAANASLIEEVLSLSPKISKHIHDCHQQKGAVDICVFGGGPGTELLGIANWAIKEAPPQPLAVDFLLLDRVNEWIGSWYPLRDELNSFFLQNYSSHRGNWPCVISGGFQKLDITKPSDVNLATLHGVFKKDLYIFCYVVSEIHDNQQDLRDFTSLLTQQAPDGSMFLFVDRKQEDGRAHPKWIYEIIELCEQADITLDNQYYPRKNQLSKNSHLALGKIFQDVTSYAEKHQSKHKGFPRKKWDAFYILGTKVEY